MSSPLRIVAELFDGLEQAGIRHCLWKGSPQLRRAMQGEKDLDLLVDDAHAIRFEHLILQTGFKRLRSQPWATYPGVEDWIGLDRETGKMVHVHLYYRLLMGRKLVEEYHLPWEELLLDTAVRDPEGGVLVADPSLEYLLLNLRIGLQTSVPAVVMASLGQGATDHGLWEKSEVLSTRADADSVERYAGTLLGERYGRSFSVLLRRDDVRAPAVLLRRRAIVRKALAEHRRFSTGRAWLTYALRRARFVAERLKRKAGAYGQTKKRLWEDGAIVAIVGCDGSGKSTVSDELERWLSWKIDARKIYLGSGDGSVGVGIRSLKSLASETGRRRTRRQQSTASGGARRQGGRRSLAREMGSCLLDLAITRERHRKVKEAHRRREKGTVLITDRYPQRQFHGIYDGPRISGNGDGSGVRRLFAKLEDRRYREIADLPPDVVIRLHVPVEVALRRKPDHDSANVREKAEITGKLTFEGAKVVDVDASQPIDVVLRSVKQAVWESF